ncbi:MAG: hypothetical protein ACI8UC_000610 [Psychromonas sp.]|jgi:hypothetical protein
MSQLNSLKFSDVLAIGPLVGLPSTTWVGNDIADHLTKMNIKVVKFNNFNCDIDADYIIVVKQIPNYAWLADKVKRNIKVLYAPVDIFHSYYKFRQYKYRLKMFAGFLVHNKAVENLLRNTSKAPCFFIEHYLKYQLSERNVSVKNRELLWIGHLEYIPSLLNFLKTADIPLNVRALSDLNNLSSFENKLSKQLSKLDIKYTLVSETTDIVYIAGICIEQWTAEKQETLMKSCVAAFDTKMDSFAHNLKPPTKAQQFIYNKIPLACSEHSYSFKYFENLGLKLVNLNELDILTSDEYCKLVSDFCEKEKWRVSIDNVSKSYIDACLNSSLPNITFFCYYRIMDLICGPIAFLLKISGKMTLFLKFGSPKKCDF